MATPKGCLDLLSMLAVADNREIDRGRAIGWAEFLHDLPDEVLLPAGRDAVREEPGYITPQVIMKFARPYLRKIARDVRSAKLRGWVPESWPEKQPLPTEVQEKLTAAWAATNDTPEEIAAAGRGTVAIGTVGRRAS